MAREYGVRLLGELPLDCRIREEADGGTPDGGRRVPTRRAPAPYSRRWRGAPPAHWRCAPRDRSGVFPKIVVEES